MLTQYTNTHSSNIQCKPKVTHELSPHLTILYKKHYITINRITTKKELIFGLRGIILYFMQHIKCPSNRK